MGCMHVLHSGYQTAAGAGEAMVVVGGEGWKVLSRVHNVSDLTPAGH